MAPRSITFQLTLDIQTFESITLDYGRFLAKKCIEMLHSDDVLVTVEIISGFSKDIFTSSENRYTIA